MLLGRGKSFSHSLILFLILLFYGQFLEAYTLLLQRVATGLTLELESLLLGCLGEFALKTPLSVTPVALFYSVVLSFTLR